MHPGDDADAIFIGIGFHAHCIYFFRRGYRWFVFDRNRYQCVVIECSSNGFSMFRHLGKCLLTIEMLAACYKPNLFLFQLDHSLRFIIGSATGYLLPVMETIPSFHLCRGWPSCNKEWRSMFASPFLCCYFLSPRPALLLSTP